MKPAIFTLIIAATISLKSYSDGATALGSVVVGLTWPVSLVQIIYKNPIIPKESLDG